MVADRVDAGDPQGGRDAGVRWESTGEGTYTIEDEPDAPQGTAVTLHLKPEDTEDALHDYTDPATVREIVKRYSDFITWPIRMAGEASAGDDERRRGVEPDVNSMKALWARPQSEVSEEEYTEFYQHVSHDWQRAAGDHPAVRRGHVRVPGAAVPARHAPMDLFMRDGKRGVQLYVKRVFIMDDCEALVPEYLRFVKGVVDANDLSLNVSREILQQDRQIQLIRKRLVKKVLSTVKTMLADEPEKYATFWSRARPGGQGRPALRPRQPGRHPGDLLVRRPPHDAEKPTTLREYVARMPEGQDTIYYVTGESRAALENSPHMEAFRAKGYEVLLLTDPVDEVWVDAVPPSRTSRWPRSPGEVDLGGDDVDDETARAGLRRRCSTWMATTLDEDVKEVRLSHRLTDLGGRAWSATPAT